jgi:hypothetical protein
MDTLKALAPSAALPSIIMVVVGAIFLSLLSVTSASTASREIEDFCLNQLQKEWGCPA